MEVRAPLEMPKAEIDQFVRSKENWIRTHLAKRQEKNSEKSAFSLHYGDRILFLGKLYPIIAKNGNRAGFNGEYFHLPPGLPPQEIKQIVVQIYKALAKKVMTDKITSYAKQMNLQPAKIGVTDAKTRWGSCSGRKNINFSWRLMMADEELVDYVAIHELAHIIEPNHSPRFWSIMERVMPDYAERKKKLNALADKLSREDWE